MDDFLSGEKTDELALQRADQLEMVLNQGGFSLKQPLSEKRDASRNLSAHDCIVNIAGMKWFPNEFVVSLYIDELNSAKKQRDKKPLQERNTIPFNLTSRQCVSKVAKVFE